jgi:chromosome segregation ATPase
MTFKDNTPTFNAGNRKIVNYKDFLQGEPQEEQELKDMKRKFKKNELEVGNQEHMSKYNKVTHKNDDLVKAEVQDKLDALEEAKKLSKSDIKEIKEEIKDLERKIRENLKLKEDYKKKSKEYEDRVKECDRLISLWEGDILDYKKELKMDQGNVCVNLEVLVRQQSKTLKTPNLILKRWPKHLQNTNNNGEKSHDIAKYKLDRRYANPPASGSCRSKEGKKRFLRPCCLQ